MKNLGFGLMRLPKLENGDIDIELVKKLVDSFMEKGFTYYDTAYAYGSGQSEKAFREAVVKRYPRDSFTVTDKLPVFSINTKEEIEPLYATMLDNLGVEYLDYFWLHALSGATYEKTVNLGCFEFAKKVKAEGKAKHIGFSFHGTDDLLDRIITEHPEMEYVQLQINYNDWNDDTVQSRRCLEVAVKHNLPVIVMEPVKGGSLVDVPEEAEKLLKEMDPSMSNASWAIRFAASQPNVFMVLSGMNSMEQMEDNTSYMMDFKPLNDSEINTLHKAAEIIRSNTTVPCTSCRYCTPVCPMDIAIPDYFAVYNTLKRFGTTARHDINNYYKNLIQIHGTPADCLKCGACEDRCPQHLSIRKYLEDVNEFFS